MRITSLIFARMRKQNYLLVRRADESENVLEGEPDYADCLGHCQKRVVLARADNDNIGNHDNDNDNDNDSDIRDNNNKHQNCFSFETKTHLEVAIFVENLESDDGVDAHA